MSMVYPYGEDYVAYHMKSAEGIRMKSEFVPRAYVARAEQAPVPACPWGTKRVANVGPTVKRLPKLNTGAAFCITQNRLMGAGDSECSAPGYITCQPYDYFYNPTSTVTSGKEIPINMDKYK